MEDEDSLNNEKVLLPDENGVVRIDGEEYVFFNPEEEKRRSKNLKNCWCGCFAFLCMFITTFISGTVYSFITPRHVPVFSSLADSIEDILTTRNSKLLNATKNLGDSVSNFLINNIGHLSFGKDLLKVDIDSEAIENYSKNLKNIESYKFDLTAKINTNFKNKETLSENQKKIPSDLRINVNGEVDQSDKSSVKAQMNYLSYVYGDTNKDLEFSARLFNNKTFIYLKNAPFSKTTNFDLIKNKWLLLEPSEDLSDGLVDYSLNDLEIKNSIKSVDKEGLDGMFKILADSNVVKKIDTIWSEDIKNVRNYCVDSYLDKNEVLEILEIIKSNLGESEELQSVTYFLQDSRYLKIQACVGRKDKYLYKLYLEGQTTSFDLDASLILDLNIWDYNVETSIEEPQDYVKFEDVFKEVFPDSGFINELMLDEIAITAMNDMKQKLTAYYIENSEYPENPSLLEDLNFPKEISGKRNIIYRRISSQKYEIVCKLSTGEEYIVTN